MPPHALFRSLTLLPRPSQALSNQKLFEVRRRFGAHRCGLQTGDTSLNTEAAIVVMTTEILRNIMYRTAELTVDRSGTGERTSRGQEAFCRAMWAWQTCKSLGSWTLAWRLQCSGDTEQLTLGIFTPARAPRAGTLLEPLGIPASAGLLIPRRCWRVAHACREHQHT